MKKSQLLELIKNVVREEQDYQQLFKHMLDKVGKSITDMSDEQKKKFFNAVDTAYKAKSEGKLRGYNEAELTAGQKKIDTDGDGEIEGSDLAALRAGKKVEEENPGLWANIRAKKARGEEPAHGNSDAHKDAVKAGKEINNEESINELTYNERQIKDGNPNNVFYAFYKGQFEAIYSAMGARGLYDMYWDKFKVRRPAGSKFKLNPEFVIVPKKEYDNSTSNHYAKLKPYVDKFWDKLQNESVVKENILNEDLDALGLLIPALGAAIGGGLAQLYPYFTGRPNIYTNIKDWWNSKKDNSEMNKIANRIKNDPDVQEFLKKKNKSGWKEMLKKKLTGSELNYLNKIYRSRFNNESVNEGTEPEVITQIKTIAKNHQHDVIVDPKSGKKMRVDAFSASAIATVYDALSSSSKEKFLASGLLGMQQMAMKLLKR